MVPSINLNHGSPIPQLGLGVWKATGKDECRKAVNHALQTGYRHIDTARIYGNEREVGVAIRESGLRREELYITTKLWNDDQGYDSALAAIDASLSDLQLDRVDLYLIHFPVRKIRKESWRALERIREEGLADAIGVSNYTIAHLEELLAEANIVPAINQVEFHTFLFQKDLLDYCNRKGIVLEAYSPLAHGKKVQDPALEQVAKKYGKTNAQILIRWCIEKNTVVIPKSTNPKRIEENFAVFDFALDPSDMAYLDSLNEDLRTCWDPTGEP